MKPYFADESVTIYQGDVRQVLDALPDESVNCCVTSPPYFGLRDYGVDGQIGLEPTPDEYIAEMVKVFTEVKRVLRDNGTLWLNIGDSYAGSWGNYGGQNRGNGNQRQISNGSQVKQKAYEGKENWRPPTANTAPGLKPKDLIGIPWMLAFALRYAGWYLRQDIIWSKPNPMPESVTDRCTKAHEYVFLLSKSERYYYNQDAIKEPAIHSGKIVSLGEKSFSKGQANGAGITPSGNGKQDSYAVVENRNKRSVWHVASSPYKEAHFATFPPELIKPCILAGCPPGGVVLEPFAGSGTTLQVAEENNCRSIGIELNPDYCFLMLKRLRQKVLQFD